MNNPLIDYSINILSKTIITQIVWNCAIIYIIPHCSSMSFPQSLLINVGLPIIFEK